MPMTSCATGLSVRFLRVTIPFGTLTMGSATGTPVPGGVGPMTIACLLLNALSAAREQNGLAEQALK